MWLRQSGGPVHSTDIVVAVNAAAARELGLQRLPSGGVSAAVGPSTAPPTTFVYVVERPKGRVRTCIRGGSVFRWTGHPLQGRLCFSRHRARVAHGGGGWKW